jgi:hypothetical protein
MEALLQCCAVLTLLLLLLLGLLHLLHPDVWNCACHCSNGWLPGEHYHMQLRQLQQQC